MENRINILRYVSMGLLFLCGTLSAQHVQLKTNLLYDATTTINIGTEFTLGKQWSIDFSGNYNGWKLGKRKWKHWMLQPEARHWLRGTLNGHYLGMHLHGGQLNLGHLPFGGHAIEEHYRQGWFYGAGFSYGYQWRIGGNWKMEAGLGLGYVRFDYDEYGCPVCGGKVGEGGRNYWGVTRLNFSFVYVLP